MSDTYDVDVFPKPTDDDIRHDDAEFNPAIEPKEAKAWLNLLRESADAFEKYNEHCDNIDRQHANLMRLADVTRDKEYQMFWANAEVLKPSIYAKPPIPVVVPKFMDRRPVYQAASEVLERCATVAFDLANIDELMKLVRDDLALLDRGVAWCRYEGKDSYYGHEKVCIDFKNRRDFLHSLSRNWREVTWVAAASYLTRAQARQRFSKSSGDEYQNAEYKVDKKTNEVGGADERERACFWEIWSIGDKTVYWVAEGCEKILDEDEPHLKLRNFFPCPKPAYGTVQRGSLVPVPDVLQYKDQLEELNVLTGRIHALSEAVEAKGFYPAGGGELSDAVQAAIAVKTPGRVLVPIANWAAFGGTKDVIIWLPIDTIAQTITALVALRQQIVQDIYQIMGLSDIMRGATDPQETLGAQQLKTEYGSVRIRDKQQEMVRLARDLVEISTEIITEKFADDTIVEMSQTQLPTRAMVKQQVTGLMQQLQQTMSQVQQAAQSPQGQQMMQQQPDQAQQLSGQAQQQVQQLQQQIQDAVKQPTIDQVLYFLKDVRAKAFVLDIETDSTIIPNEQAEKQARAEFTGVLAQLLPQLSQMIMAEPRTAEFCGEILKFTVAPYRAGRSLDGAIDKLSQMMNDKADQPKGDDPTTAQNKAAIQIEQIKDNTAQMKIRSDQKIAQDKLAQDDRHKEMELQNQRDMKQMEINAKGGDDQAKMQVQNQKLIENREAHQAEMIQKQQELQNTQVKGEQQMALAAQKQQHLDQRAQDQRTMMQFKAMQPPTQPQGRPQ